MADRIVQLSDDEGGPSFSQTANCRCGTPLDFRTNGHGVVFEWCAHCHGGRPLRVKVALPVHRCRYCSEALDGTYEPTATVCRRCAPRARSWAKCVGCGGNCRQTRCSECRQKWQQTRTRAQEQARRDRLKEYFARTESNGNN